jgi:hypothetical protein
MHADADLLEFDAVTGRKTAFPDVVQRVLRAMNASKIRYSVIGAMALAVRGLPRMTRDVDLVVLREDAFRALKALEAAGFRSVTPVDRRAEPEPMYVLESAKPKGEADLLVAAGEPESSVIDESKRTKVYGVTAPVASLEHLLLMYLYSNQPKHLGDFARIVVETDVNLLSIERYLQDVHPEMLGAFRERVMAAKHPPSPPERPRKKRRRAKS